MNNSMGMYQGYSVEGSAELKVTPDTMKPMMETSCNSIPGPVNTRIINHHIYKHTYSPCYTCTEENEICNVHDNCCGGLM